MVAIDTAGLRKRAKVADDVEYYSQHRSLRSVRRADVALLLLDATEPVGVVDKQLGQYIASEFKPTVLVINKWDLARALAEQEQYGTYLTELLPELSYAPIVFTSAITSLGITQAIRMAEQLHRQAQVRVGTAELNQVIEQITQMQAPRSAKSGKPGKIYYAAQIETTPPTIACFVNFVDAFDTSYQRFLLNQLRQRLPFAEVPIRLLFRPRRKQDTQK
jgi:GTP-binding protein